MKTTFGTGNLTRGLAMAAVIPAFLLLAGAAHGAGEQSPAAVSAAPAAVTASPSPATSQPRAMGVTAAPAAVTYAPAINFAGKILEKGTRRAIADATVLIRDTSDTAIAGRDGTFGFTEVPAGEHEVAVAAVGYKNYKTKETIEPDKKTDVVYYIEPLFRSPYEIVVTDKREAKEVSKTTLTRTEMIKMPGSGGDAVRAIEALPGVNTMSEGSGDLLIRGSSPGSNLFFYNRIQSPMVYHFGGLRSIYNGETIDRIDFLAGGFGARYGANLDGAGGGGVVDIYTRDPRTDRVGGFLDVGLLMAEGLVEGPAGSDKLSYSLSGKRSYIDLVIGKALSNDQLQFKVFPNFWDYQGSLVYKPDRYNRFALYSIGYRDTTSMVFKETNPNEPEMGGNLLFDQFFHGWGSNLDVRITDTLKSYASPAFGYNRFVIRLGEDIHIIGQSEAWILKEMLEWKPSPAHTVAFGFDGDYGKFTGDFQIIRPPTEGDPYISFSNDQMLSYMGHVYPKMAVGWIEDQMAVTEDLQITPGARYNYSEFHNEGNEEPRLSARYKLTETTALKSAWGIYHEFPPPVDVIPPFGQPGLKSAIVTHYIAGVEQDVWDRLKLDVQTYYKTMDRLVSPTGLQTPYYNNDGKGYSYGAEVFLRHSLVDRFFGWISYSYNVSRRNYGGGDYKIFEWDQPHTINIVGNYQITARWDAGAKWRYSTGKPYTPYYGAIFNADNGTYIPIPGDLYSKRLPDYQRLDLRTDYRFIFDTWSLNTYFELINAYMAKNPVGVGNNYDYTKESYSSMFPFLPNLGVKASF